MDTSWRFELGVEDTGSQTLLDLDTSAKYPEARCVLVARTSNAPPLSPRLDALVLVPFEPHTASFLDPQYRSTIGGRMAELVLAFAELEEHVGMQLRTYRRQVGPGDVDPTLRPLIKIGHCQSTSGRSLSALALTSALDRVGLAWAALDPGQQELSWWRAQIASFRPRAPRTVVVNTTFLQSLPWLHALLWSLRRDLPEARILVGGYFYALNAQAFLSLDADVLCVGEGEVRLPQIVRAIAQGESLEAIPGLYIRDASGSLRSTGKAETLTMDELPPIDYRLAARIAPEVDLDQDVLVHGVETQRGCVFKCEFCTYRTLNLPNVMNAALAADAILATKVSRHGYIALTDATATFPHDRWEELLTRLIEKGGTPYPAWAYARVTDINERRAELMAKAGIRGVLIGQESGDQRLLGLMKKGTHVSQVGPAIAALGRHGISAQLSFIHGFPGETPESIQNTRNLVLGLNVGHEARPVVLSYFIHPFQREDLAVVSARAELKALDHSFTYDHGGFSGKRVAEEVLNTIVAASRVPHAPANYYIQGMFLDADAQGVQGVLAEGRYELFKFSKSVDLGVGVFLERLLEGRPIDDTRLRIAADGIRRYAARSRRDRSLGGSLRRATGTRVFRRFSNEFSREAEAGPGALTRTYLAVATYLDTRDVRLTIEALRSGRYPDLAPTHFREDAGLEEAAHGSTLADHLVTEAHDGPARWREQRRRVHLQVVE